MQMTHASSSSLAFLRLVRVLGMLIVTLRRLRARSSLDCADDNDDARPRMKPIGAPRCSGHVVALRYNGSIRFCTVCG